MKKFFCFCPFFTTCLCIVYIFSSCAATITITGSDPKTGQLTLVDSKGKPANVFDTIAGISIKWKIGKESGVSSIGYMAKKEGSDDIFRKKIHKKFLSKSWKGKTEKYEELKEKFKGKETTEGYFIEDYFIDWKDKNDSTHKFDPRIQVKS
jgi:hypothetical protein